MSGGVAIGFEMFSRLTNNWFPRKSQRQDPDHMQNRGGWVLGGCCSAEMGLHIHFTFVIVQR